MPIERPYVVYWRIFVKPPPPFIQAASRGSRGILGIQGQQNHLIAAGGLKLSDGLARERMPIAHGHKAARIQPLAPQLSLQRECLLLREPPDRRASANGCIVMLYFSGTRGRDKFGQSFTAETGKRKVNNIGIAEKVIKERLYRSQRIGPAQLKKNYSHTARCVRHPL